MDILASDLARELNMPVAELLQRADDLIGAAWPDAAGMTTRVRQREQYAVVLVSEELAQALRANAKSSGRGSHTDAAR